MFSLELVSKCLPAWSVRSKKFKQAPWSLAPCKFIYFFSAGTQSADSFGIIFWPAEKHQQTMDPVRKLCFWHSLLYHILTRCHSQWSGWENMNNTCNQWLVELFVCKVLLSKMRLNIFHGCIVFIGRCSWYFRAVETPCFLANGHYSSCSTTQECPTTLIRRPLMQSGRKFNKIRLLAGATNT